MDVIRITVAVLLVIVLVAIAIWASSTLQQKTREINSFMKVVDRQGKKIQELEEQARMREDALITTQQINHELSVSNEAQELALKAIAYHLQESPSAHVSTLSRLGRETIIAIAVAPGQIPPQTILVFGSENPIYDSWALIDIIVDMDDAEDDEVLGRTIQIKAPGCFALIWTSSPNITALPIPPMS